MGADPPTLSSELVRRVLRRRDLAAARQRALLGRRLGLTDTEMLAVAHLAHRGQLSPSRIGALLGLSTGGTSALVQRLEATGAVTRRPHPTDGRRSLIRLAPEVAAHVEREEALLLRRLERLAAGLDAGERVAVARFLARLADLSEEVVEPQGDPVPTEASPVPSLWS